MNYDQLLDKLKQDLSAQVSPFAYTKVAFVCIVLALLLVAIIWGMFALYHVYRVWAAHKEGQAELAKAHNEQQIQVSRAQGRLDAAELNKKAEIIDASAVAASVEIIGKALHENTGYLQWKWIHMMEERDSGDTIYVPTEAGLPILEAGKRIRE